MYTLEGVSSVANFITAYVLMESLNKTVTPIFLSAVCSLFPKAIFCRLLFYTCKRKLHRLYFAFSMINLMLAD